MIPKLREMLRAASDDLAFSSFSTKIHVVEDSFASQNLAAASSSYGLG